MCLCSCGYAGDDSSGNSIDDTTTNGNSDRYTDNYIVASPRHTFCNIHGNTTT